VGTLPHEVSYYGLLKMLAEGRGLSEAGSPWEPLSCDRPLHAPIEAFQFERFRESKNNFETTKGGEAQLVPRRNFAVKLFAEFCVLETCRCS
jgi:hypothetical protein